MGDPCGWGIGDFFDGDLTIAKTAALASCKMYDKRATSAYLFYDSIVLE
jgi:hypothetical protein